MLMHKQEQVLRDAELWLDAAGMIRSHHTPNELIRRLMAVVEELESEVSSYKAMLNPADYGEQ